MKVEQNIQEKLLETQDGDENGINSQQTKSKPQYIPANHYLSQGNPLQLLFFLWIFPLLKHGSKHLLDPKSLPNLKPQDRSQIHFQKLSKAFQAYSCSYSSSNPSQKPKRKGIILLRSGWKVFKKELLGVFGVGIFVAGLQMYNPILCYDVIQYIDNGDKELGTGLWYFFGIFGVTLFLAIAQTFLWYFFAVLGFNLSNTLSLLIYTKSLSHPILTKKSPSISQILNHSQIDAQKMTYMGFQLLSLFSAPFQVFIGLVLLYFYIGVSFVVGVAVMVGLAVVTVGVGRMVARRSQGVLEARDLRIKATQQMLKIIKYIKINTLQKHFYTKISKPRQTQLQNLHKLSTYTSLNIFLFYLCAPLIVSCTFLVYVGIGQQITAGKAFFTIIIFNILQYPLTVFPNAVTEFVQILGALRRIQGFLTGEGMVDGVVEEGTRKEQGGQQEQKGKEKEEMKWAIEIQRGNFMWGKQKSQQDQDQKDNSTTTDTQSKSQSSILTEPPSSQQHDYLQTHTKVLHNINLKIPSQKLTMIIGDIGSGKSSLLYAILNQMTPEPGAGSRIRVNGEIAFSAQKAWIMAGTIKDNITFFQPYSQPKFTESLHQSHLLPDLQSLQSSTSTQVGQNGCNLSGGQRTRVSLARCLYSDKDIYLLDDILSAVDVHVGRFLMEDTVLGWLRDRKKTVVMVTHAIEYVAFADFVVVMDKGCVVVAGGYQEVRDSPQFRMIMEIQTKKSKQKQLPQPEPQPQPQFQPQPQVQPQLQLQSKHQPQPQHATTSVNRTQNPTDSTKTDKIIEQLILPQDRNKGQISPNVYLEYVKFNGGILFGLAVLACSFGWILFAVLANIRIQIWCEDEHKSIIHLYLYLVFAMSSTILTTTTTKLLLTTSLKSSSKLHKKTTKSLLYASLTQFYNRVPLGRILNRLSKDLREVDQVVAITVGDFLGGMMGLLGNLAVCGYVGGWAVGLVAAAVGALCWVLMRYYLRTQRQCVRIQTMSLSPIATNLTSTLHGLPTIRSFKVQPQFLNLQLQHIDLNKRATISKQAMQAWVSQRLAFLSFFVNMSALGLCIFGGGGSGALGGLLLTYAGLLSNDFVWFVYCYASMQLKMISVQRMLNFSKIQPQIAYKQYCQNWTPQQQGSDPTQIPFGQIQFQNFSTRYRKNLPLALHNITLKIPKGQKIGIVGRTGSGKSTLLNSLVRMVEPVEGKIFIDGKEIRDYRVKDLRACITMIQQEPVVVQGSFRENLDPIGVYTDDEILKGLKECHLEELVESKGGLYAKISSNSLSSGQKQLICICRNLLKKTNLILLDEATSNIDPKTDTLLQQTISTALKNSTVLTIAHRLSTLKNCDRILVLHCGRVEEWGTREELVGKIGGKFWGMLEQNDCSYFG